MWNSLKKTNQKKKKKYKAIEKKNQKFSEYTTQKYQSLRTKIKKRKQEIEKELKSLDDKWIKIKNSLSRGLIREKLKNRKKWNELIEEYEYIKSGNSINDFKESIMPYMEAYERESHVRSMEKIKGTGTTICIDPNKKPTDGNTIHIDKSNDSEVFKNYLEEKENQAPEIKIMSHEICEDCDSYMATDTRSSILICPECGYIKSYIDATSSHMAYGEEVEFTSFAYLKYNHFNEQLMFAQAKESTEVPPEILQKVMEWLYTNRISLKNITLDKTLKGLKELGLRSYYKQNTQIWCKITGNPPLRMAPEHEEQLRLMFKAVNRLWPKYKPPGRKNFLSYKYCLYKFNELLGYVDFLPYFKLLKGDKKLAKQDEILEKIFRDSELNWDFTPSKNIR